MLVAGDEGEFLNIIRLLSVVVILIIRYLTFSHINMSPLSCCSGSWVGTVEPTFGSLHIGSIYDS